MMTKEELIHLQDYAANQARQLAMEATVAYDDSDGSIAVTVITRAGGGPPRSVRRSAKFRDRAQIEEFIDDAIQAARLAAEVR
jgi:hypothetical protein